MASARGPLHRQQLHIHVVRVAYARFVRGSQPQQRVLCEMDLHSPCAVPLGHLSAYNRLS